ncbi:MAG: ferrous iron transport protein A [Anaerolineaceae bacterium]|nr:ferrous iron transport protein A [Anaerolineaceae bacterium]
MSNPTTITTLDQLRMGQTAHITELTDKGASRHRLMDLGILPGTKVEIEMKSPLADPVAYRIRGAVIALRRLQAQQIKIEIEPTEK